MSGQGFRLVPLECPSCGASVAAQGEDVVYYCTACRNGYRFDGTTEELAPMEVAFVTAPAVAVDRYLPFWLLNADVKIKNRVATGGGLVGLMGTMFGGDRDPVEQRAEGVFAVPAFHAPLESVTLLIRRFTESLPSLGERLGERLVGGCYGVEDAKTLVHYALIAGEVGKPDLLKRLKYKVRFGEARLLGVPFVDSNGKLADAFFGIKV